MIICICILWLSRMNKNDFTNVNSKKDKIDPTKDGKMSFDYLTNPNYDRDVLGKYYLDDDIIINNSKLVNHYYQKKRDNHWGFLYNYVNTNSDPSAPFATGSFRNTNMMIPNLATIARSDLIYNTYKVRL